MIIPIDVDGQGRLGMVLARRVPVALPWTGRDGRFANRSLPPSTPANGGRDGNAEEAFDAHWRREPDPISGLGHAIGPLRRAAEGLQPGA